MFLYFPNHNLVCAIYTQKPDTFTFQVLFLNQYTINFYICFIMLPCITGSNVKKVMKFKQILTCDTLDAEINIHVVYLTLRETTSKIGYAI